MSYTCEDCKEAVTLDHRVETRQGEKGPVRTVTAVPAKPNRVVVKTRPVYHEPRTYRRRKVAPEQSTVIKDPGGHGTQIVREANLCGKCVARRQPSQTGTAVTA